jgi:hypothetical protein
LEGCGSTIELCPLMMLQPEVIVQAIHMFLNRKHSRISPII